MMVRTENRPRAIIYFDLKEELLWDIKDPWSFSIPQPEDLYLSHNPIAVMFIHEFNKHLLNTKHLGSIIRFENQQGFTLKTSYERQ